MRGKTRGKRRARIVDITIRLRRRDGRKATVEEARAALWAAHKIAQKGGSVTQQMKEWKIEAVNWRNTYSTGKFKDFTYDEADNLDDVLANMGGILETIGMAALRVAVVNRKEQ